MRSLLTKPQPKAKPKAKGGASAGAADASPPRPDQTELAERLDRARAVRSFTPVEQYQPRHRADVPAQ